MRRKTLASLISLWFVACGFLAQRHEATVAHAVEAATGQLVHAERLTGHHVTQAVPDIHERTSDHGDHDACIAAVMLRTALVMAAAPSLTGQVQTEPHEIARGAALTAPGTTHVYRLAPKTSPPVG